MATVAFAHLSHEIAGKIQISALETVHIQVFWHGKVFAPSFPLAHSAGELDLL